MRSKQNSGLTTVQFAILAVLGLVALCALLGAAFVFINKQFNPPVPTALSTSAPASTSAAAAPTSPGAIA